MDVLDLDLDWSRTSRPPSLLFFFWFVVSIDILFKGSTLNLLVVIKTFFPLFCVLLCVSTLLLFNLTHPLPDIKRCFIKKNCNFSRWRLSRLRWRVSRIGKPRPDVRRHRLGPRQHRDRTPGPRPQSAATRNNSPLASAHRKACRASLNIVTTEQVRIMSVLENRKCKKINFNRSDKH